MPSPKQWHPPRSLDGAGLAIVLVTLALGAVAMLTRHRTSFWDEVPLLGALSPGQHLSNFAISLMLLVGICQFPLLMNARRMIAVFMAAVLVLNFVVETWIPVLNTPDPRDAVAGVAGVVVAGISLWLVDRVGTRPTPPRS